MFQFQFEPSLPAWLFLGAVVLPYLLVLIPSSFVLVLARGFGDRDRKLAALACLIVLGMFAGFRGFVGIDTYMYHLIYTGTRTGPFMGVLAQVEPVFAFLVKVTYWLYDSSFLFVGLIAILQGILVLVLLRTSQDPPGFLLLYMANFYLAFQFNILRAGTAILFLAMAVRWVRKKEGWKFYLFSFLAVMCHFSAVVGFFPLFIFHQENRKVRLFLLLVVLALLFGLYLAIGHADLAPEKYAGYLVMDLRAEIRPSFTGLAIRIFINCLLYYLVVNRENAGLLRLLLLLWLVMRLLSVKFVLVDRIEIIYSALYIFYCFEQVVAGTRWRIRTLAFAGLTVLSLASNIRGLTLDETQLARGSSVIDFNHSMSPYLPYKFFWQKQEP